MGNTCSGELPKNEPASSPSVSQQSITQSIPQKPPCPLPKARDLAILKRTEEHNICRSSFGTKTADYDTLLSTEWAQIEAIGLVNDKTGLGFETVGTGASGVMVRAISPGSIAARDGRLQTGDYILEICGVSIHSIRSEELAKMLRQYDTRIRLVVARPTCLSVSSFVCKDVSTVATVPTRLLSEPLELDRYLIDNQYSPSFVKNVDYINVDARDEIENNNSVPSCSQLPCLPASLPLPPEMIRFRVELKKDHNDLGIMIVGYVSEIEELSGFFVKAITKNSIADLSGEIQINDRIVEVDGHTVQTHTSYQVVEMLRNTSETVTLGLVRYLRGPIYEQLQQAIEDSEFKPSLPTRSLRASRILPTEKRGYDLQKLEDKPVETKPDN